MKPPNKFDDFIKNNNYFYCFFNLLHHNDAVPAAS